MEPRTAPGSALPFQALAETAADAIVQATLARGEALLALAQQGLGVDFAQGFWIGAPRPVAELEPVLT